MSSNINPSEDPNFEPKRQGCGYTLAISVCIFGLLGVIAGPLDPSFFEFLVDPERSEEFRNLLYRPDIFDQIFLRVGSLLVTAFFIMALHYPGYTGGNPKFVKLLPLVAGIALSKIYEIRISIFSGHYTVVLAILKGLGEVCLSTAIFYFIYIKDDSNPGACCLCLKPWVYKRKEAEHGGYPQYGVQAPQGYPPYGAPPPQGYPPYGVQAPQGYPPYGAQVPQGYPPQGYPPQGHHQHMMQQGNPQQGPPAYQTKK